MSTPHDLPERQSRARNALGAGAPTAGTGRPTRPAERPTTSRPEPDGRAVDLDRLRASAASALDAEHTQRSAAEPAPSPGDGLPGWLKVALPIGVVAALATVGLAMTGGDETATRAASAPTTAAANRSTTAPADQPATTAAPTTTPAAPATDAPTTVAPTTAPPAVADASAVPHHKATYRAGKLYLEGSITSAEEAQKYVEKAAAVLGPDNVVNNYVIDPTVPLSTDGTVYVDEPFLFETGSAELNPSYTGVLGLGIAALKLNPNARMVVTGYTDNKGDPAKNQELSLARATAVVDYMVTSGGIDRARFDAIGAGDRDPVGDNATEEGRALNRRIDVKLVNLLG